MRVVTAPNAPAFFNAATDTRGCMRCSSGIKRTTIRSKDMAQGLYALVAQVLSDDTLRGGMLCGKCAVSFVNWMEGEDQDDG
jgi:hypothetical protein